MIMLDVMVKLLMCHMLGDYFFQTDFIAKSKGENLYHLFVHVVLYCVPFAAMYGINYKLYLLFLSHLAIDALKARYGKITYVQDQVVHYLVIILLYIVL